MPGIAQLLVRIDATTEQLRRELATADGALSKFSNNTDRQLSNIDNSFAKLGRGIQGIQGLLGGLGVAMGGIELAKGFTAMADAATTMENRLRGVTTSAADLANAQELLYRSSQENSVETSASVEMFARLSRALQGTGADTERVVEMVDTLSKATRLSGISSTEASSALLQLSQALNKGTLNGDEFRSMAENMPMLLQAIAEHVANLNGISLDQARAELSKMSEDGELTTEIVVGALENMRRKTVEAFSEIQETAANATTQMWNALTRLVGKLDDVTGVSGNVVNKINAVTAAFDFGIDALDRYGGALSTLLGWLNAIPHPLGLIGQAAAGAAAQVSQAVGEIQELVARAADLKGTQELADKLAGGLKVIEATGGRPVAPAVTNPMDIAAIAGAEVDFTTFGATKLGGITGVPQERPKLKFYKGPSKEEEKAAKKAIEDEKRAIERVTKDAMTARDKYDERVAELKDLFGRQKIPEEVYKKALADAEEDYKRATKPKGGGRKPKKSEAEKEEERAQKAAEREGKSVFEKTRTDAEAYAEEIKRLDELLARNAISQEEHARAVQAAGLAMQQSKAEFVGGQDAARAYHTEIARLDGLLQSGAISQDEHNTRVLDAQQKYSDAKSSAGEYASEVARLDAALAAGAISEEEHAASLALARNASNEAMRESARLWEETRTPLERYTEELEKLSELWAAGVIGDDTRMRAALQLWEELRGELEETNATMKASKALGEDLGMAFASSFEDAILEGGKLRDIMQGLWKDIQRIVVRQMVTVPLATGLSSILTGVTGAMMGGGATAMPARPAFQHGGFVRGSGSGISDSIPAIMPGGGLARLSNGEFIVNAKAAARHERLLTAINSGSLGHGFAVGGPIGNLGMAAAAGGPGRVQIILENKSNTPLKTEGGRQEGPGPDGRTMIRVMVVDAMKGALAGGEFDRTMGARYGSTVQPIGR